MKDQAGGGTIETHTFAALPCENMPSKSQVIRI